MAEVRILAPLAHPFLLLMARTGYTLPVFSVAAAKAALTYLLNPIDSLLSVAIDLLPDRAEIPIQNVARLDRNSALAVTLSDPGDNLDLTRNTPIWTWVSLSERQSEALMLEAGEGLGKSSKGDPAIYDYAHRLFTANLLPMIPGDRTVTVKIILPEGRQLAQRTSNAAFGILEGLALLGTSGLSQPFSVEEHLETLRGDLAEKVAHQPHIVFCIGASGRRVAERLGIPDTAIAQTGNWLGALMVEAGLQGAQSLILLGYQGKLVKLAGGIFNTSSHLADAKLEILAAAVVRCGGSLGQVEAVLNCQTADAAYLLLREQGLASKVFTALAEVIAARSQAYVQKYADIKLEMGTILCDRQGTVIAQTNTATKLLARIYQQSPGLEDG
jgi:cobalt-precorrin-5B (C1)-methyltransferase